MTGAIIDAAEALRIGLVGRVVAPAATAQELARRLARGPPVRARGRQGRA